MDFSFPFEKSLIERYASAIDASYYLLVPEAVARPKTERDVVELMRYCSDHGRSLTFRASGTSLAGQAQSRDILMDVSRDWNKIEILDEGLKVRAECGAILGKINEKLKKSGRKIGPDPASIKACRVGGAAANNSSGMSSGIRRNPYNTIDSMRFILPSGLTIDTSRKDCDDVLKEEEPDLYEKILEIRKEVTDDSELANLIRRSYELKNVMGYSLNSFVDHERPVDILSRLVIGSEGTLAFVSEVVFRTFPTFAEKFTGLIFFRDVRRACDALPGLIDLGAVALELMDYFSLRSLVGRPGVPRAVETLEPDTAAILFEFESESREKLNSIRSELDGILNKPDLARDPIIAETQAEREALWNVRQGLLTSVAAARRSGTSAVIEDISFRINDLGAALTDLRKLFDSSGFDNVGTFGHGLDGNVHFILAVDFADPADITKFKNFLDKLAVLVVDDYGGSLKAEHGVGRNMAPYLEKQWGSRAVELMKRIKRVVDPNGILNPEAMFVSDAEHSFSDMKTLPPVDESIDRCIECGFCAPICPSAGLTLSPRTRIALKREIKRNSSRLVKEKLLYDFDYYGLHTCAGDGLCEIACPVDINTGDLVKKTRAENKSYVSKKIAKIAANNFNDAEFMAKTAVKAARSIGSVIGDKALVETTKTVSRVAPGKLPVWNKSAPNNERFPSSNPDKPDFVYFPCCVSRIFSGDRERNIVVNYLKVSELAGFKIKIPSGIHDYCCGMAFHSKGYFEAYRIVLNKTITMLYDESRQGAIPIFFDSTSCTHSLGDCKDFLSPENRPKYNRMNIFDATEYLHDYVISRIELKKVDKKVALHPNCSLQKMNLIEKFKRIAEFCAKEVIMPYESGCCGFAGDRGFLVPELTESATKKFAEEVIAANPNACYSTNVPCEIGMSESTGLDYRPIVELVLEAAIKTNEA